MRYSGGEVSSVQIHFNGNDEQRTVNINGYIPLTAEEYQGNESIPALVGIVREHVASRLLEESE